MSLTLRITITIAVLLTGSAVLVLLVVLPAAKDMRLLADTIESEYDRVNRSVNRALEFRELYTMVDQMKKNLPEMEHMLITHGDELNFLTFLEQTSRAHRLEHKLRIDPTIQAAAHVDALPLSIEVRGRFFDVVQYLIELEHADALFTIRAMNIRNVHVEPNAPHQVLALIEGTVYVTK